MAGYFLYYGNASRTYSGKLDVGYQTRVTIDNLTPSAQLPAPGLYYFVVTAYIHDSNSIPINGILESTATNELQVEIF